MPDFYGTEAGFETYLEARGITQPAGEVVPALHRASTWIDANWGSQFSGYKATRTQLRAWPRVAAYYNLGGGVTEAIDSDETPVEVEYATYEAAIQELTSPNSLMPVITPSKSFKRVRVEGAVEVEFANTGTFDSKPVITSVSGILAPLLNSLLNDGSGLYGVAYRV